MASDRPGRRTWTQMMRDLADWVDKKADKIEANGNPASADAERRKAEEWRNGPRVEEKRYKDAGLL